MGGIIFQKPRSLDRMENVIQCDRLLNHLLGRMLSNSDWSGCG
jgi:hypothetical protein